MSAPYVVTITDETVMGEVINEIKLPFTLEKLTARDIIVERVKYEVDLYNNKVFKQYYGLVQPTKAEKLLNSFKLSAKIKVDVNKQINTALKAFEENGFFMLVGDFQIEKLDQTIDFDKTNISFVKLTPLVGG